ISMAWPRTRSARPTSGEAVPRARTRQNRGALLVAIGPAADRGEPAVAVRLRLDLRLRPAPAWLAAALVAALALHGLAVKADAVLAWLMLQAFRLRDGRPWLSGLLWATACLLKPPYLLFALLVAAGRRWRIAAGFGVGLALASALEVARFGLAGSAAQLHAWRELLEKTTPSL